MKKILLGFIGTFVLNNIMGVLVAKFILSPTLDESFGTTLRPIDALEFLSLTGGYLILSIIMVMSYPYFKFDNNWKTNGLIFGVICGGMTFLSDHMITAGWSILPPTPMLISGIIDILVTITSGLFLSFIFRNGKQS